MNNPAIWEIRLAQVRFEDNPKVTKNRPVLVIDEENGYVLSLKITSHPPRRNFEKEYEIIKWEQAGLNKKSTIRASKVLKMKNKDFIHKIRRLGAADIINLMKMLQSAKEDF